MSDKQVEEQVEFIAKQVAAKVFDFLDQQRKEKGYEFVLKLSNSFLQRYVYVVVLNTLSSYPINPGTPEELDEFVNRSYIQMKHGMQESIAFGFQKALSTYEGRQVEFYCHLVPVTQPANKQPC